MNRQQRLTLISCAATVAASLWCAPNAGATPVVYTNEGDWQNAVLALSPVPTIKTETFNGANTPIPPGLSGGVYYPPNNPPGTGDFSMTLNNVGNGGSQSGILNNQFHMRLAEDTSDIDLGFIVLGEGAKSIDFNFAQKVLAFGGTWSNGTQTGGVGSADGINIVVNGVPILLAPTGGTGFFGILDTAGLTSFTLEPGSQSQTQQFQEADLDNFKYALPGTQPPPTGTPEPGTLILFGIGAMAGRRFSIRRQGTEN